MSMDRVEEKVDKLDDRLDDIDQHLAVYNEQLKVHIKRTDQIERELRPVVKHVEQVKGITKFLAALATITGLIIAYFKV